jgi:hypothetical protein
LVAAALPWKTSALEPTFATLEGIIFCANIIFRKYREKKSIRGIGWGSSVTW